MPEPDEASGPTGGEPDELDGAVESVEAQGAEELTDWERKRRLAEIFGDVLPTTTSDERSPGAGDSGESANDAWLRRQVPPHHGG